ncbi:hypothetical protein Taro_011764 [Colocasia esculenta]|uniref:Uncharacterized protein n=1 Tax=Colocasia esculenta TaxID=4460 RepID=A0A843UBM3_COLES|nr:hypothetical protein [Colocasia esculenta]
MTGKPYPPLAATPASRRPPRGNLVIWASQRPVPPLQRPLPHPHTHSLLTRANRFGRKRSRLYSSFDPGGETEAMVALHFSLSTLPSPSPARPAPRALGRVVPASLQPSGWRRGAEPGWSVGASASLSSSSSGSIGDRASRTPSVRSSLEIAGPTVGTVTEVDKDTFWPLVEAAGGKVVVLDMYTQWGLSRGVAAPPGTHTTGKH